MSEDIIPNWCAGCGVLGHSDEDPHRKGTTYDKGRTEIGLDSGFGQISSHYLPRPLIAADRIDGSGVQGTGGPS